MPPVYLGAVVNGQMIRYLHSTPPTPQEADRLANDLNRGMASAAYFVDHDE